MNSIKTRSIVISGINIALVFVSCYFIQFHLPFSLNSGGLVHLGNITLFTIAMVYGKKQGAIAGAFGMGLFDIMAGWQVWAPCTFVVRGIMGWLIGTLYDNKKENKVIFYLMLIIIPSIEMLAGYFIYNVAMYGNYIAALSSIPGDLTQLAIGYVVAIPVANKLSKLKIFKRGNNEN
ncbi:MAG: ECF transporter S component [Clostridiales bacterium]|nr:MAG: ECF transporter S component [Clostridiales bacterium]